MATSGGSNSDPRHTSPVTCAPPRTLTRSLPVRFIVFFVVLVAANAGAELTRIWVSRHAPARSADSLLLITALVLAVIVVGIYIGLVRGVESRKTDELSATRAIGMASGALLGFALFATVLGVLWVSGIARVHGLSVRAAPVPMLAGAIVAAVGEEIAFRGGVFRILESGLGTTTALALSAALFGLAHGLNPGATAMSTTAIALEAGVLLGAAYALTRNLWFCIGLHFGWNFTEGGVFGAAVSGFSGNRGILPVSLSGPDLLTGGKFGPEASVVAAGICFAAALVLIALAVRKQRWIPLRARMMADG